VSDDLLYELAERVNYNDARLYALSRGWMQVKGRRLDIGIFRLGDHEAILPMDTSLGDYVSAMVQFARRIAAAERRGVDRVLQDLLAPAVDRHRPARLGANDASLEGALSLLDGIQRALLASACSVLQPRPFHPRMSLSQAEEFVRATRFTSTEVGSFVVVIDTPIDVESSSPGFGREVSRELMRSLEHISTAIRSGEPDRIVNPQGQEPLVSSNLCEALLRMAPQSEASDLRFAISWSPLKPAPIGIASEISIDRTMYEPLERVASQLRPARSKVRGQYLAFVKELKGWPGDSGPEGEVVFELIMEDGRQRARATLDATLYQVALRAHAASSPILVEAEVHRGRRGAELQSLTTLKPLFP
jgi:hypothetical protein